MTDPITDAVRRLKQLQQDVERLKAGQNEEGEPRLFVAETDRAAARDEENVRPNDVAATELVTVADTLALRPNDVAAAETVRASDSLAVRDRDVAASETAAATDTLTTVGEAVTPAYWNEAAWNASEYPDA